MKQLKKLPKGKLPAAMKKPKINFDDIQEGISTFSEGVSAVSEGVTAFTDGVQAVSEIMPSQFGAQQQPRQNLQSEDGTESAAPVDKMYNIKISFDDAFIEPKDAETIDCWKNILRTLYMFYIKCTYNFFMFLCGICVVTCWGITNSCLAWLRIWCLLPMTSVVLVFLKGCLPLILEPIAMFRQVCCGRKKKASTASIQINNDEP